MRSITLMGTAAVVLSVTTLLAVPASAERICRQVCDEGFCRSRCVLALNVTGFAEALCARAKSTVQETQELLRQVDDLRRSSMGPVLYKNKYGL